MEVSAPDFASHPLSGVLNDEHLLRRTLKYVVDDVPECRRVCRMWKRVCDKLPVRLNLSKKADANAVLHRFQNAVSVSCFILARPDAGVVADEARRLAEMPQLVELKLIQADMFVVHREWASLKSLAALLPRLESLSFRSWFFKDTACEILEGLRGLSNLTHLSICSFSLHARKFELEPLTELQQLQRLEIDQFSMLSQKSNLLFPSTCLRALCIYAQVGEEVYLPDVLRERIESYAPSLRSLDAGGGQLFVDYDTLLFLLKLKELESLSLKFGEFISDYFSKLTALTALTKLRVRYELGNSPRRIRFLSVFTMLKSLELDCSPIHYKFRKPSLIPYPSLQQLTSLSVAIGTCSSDVGLLTNLVDLSICIGLANGEDLSSGLSRLIKLESLTAEFAAIGESFGESLRCLRQLKRLNLCLQDSYEEALIAAASLTALTGLTVYWSEGKPYQLLCPDRLGQLSNLVDLGVVNYPLLSRSDRGKGQLELLGPEQSFPRCLPRTFVEESLPRLRYLRLSPWSRVSEEIKMQFFQRFACLRAVVDAGVYFRFKN